MKKAMPSTFSSTFNSQTLVKLFFRRADFWKKLQASVFLLPFLLVSPILSGQNLKLEQGQNGGYGLPVVSPVNWATGNSNEGNSHYFEGQSNPYRLVISKLSKGNHSVVIEYDIRKDNKSAIDYLTNFQRIGETVDPTSGLGNMGSPSYFAIPTPQSNIMVAGTSGTNLQPVTSFNQLSANEKRLTIWKGTINGVSYVSEGDPTQSSSSTQIKIDFSAPSNNSTVVIAWGGHIASVVDWGNPNSSSDIGGAYHTRLISFDGSNTGSQSLSLKIPDLFRPTCSITGTSSVCQNSSGTYSAVTNAPVPSYLWTVTGGTITSGQGTASIAVNWTSSTGSVGLQVTEQSSPSTPSSCSFAVTVNALPSAPTAGNVISCFTGNVISGSAAAGADQTIEWFTAATGGSATTAPSGTNPGTYTAYAQAKNTTTNCVSASRTLVTVTIQGLPAAPTAGNLTVCYSGAAYTGTATVGAGQEVVWYTAATGGSITAAPSGTNTGTYSAYAEAKNTTTNCVSASRTLVTVIINELPPLTVEDAVLCSTVYGGTTAVADLTSYVTHDGGTVSYSSGGNIISNPQAYTATNGEIINVTVADGNSCSSAASFTITVSLREIFGICSEGKVFDLIGSELTMLNALFDPENPVTTNDVFFINGDKVLIEIIFFEDQLDALLAIIEGPDYGFTYDPEFSDEAGAITGVEDDFVLAGFMPIANLKKLNPLVEYIQYARPAFPPIILNSEYREEIGRATSQGDITMRSDLVRLGYFNNNTGFPISGAGIKIGIISDSYNSLGAASTDMLNFDLPGVDNAFNTYNNLNPVQILKDFPYGAYGPRSDEGRAMLQIVHDVAPKADLAFRTGFLTAGDFARGIRDLKDNPLFNCDIIVDDVTYITEPFFTDGKVAQAVDYVTSEGVSYFTAAGNFGNKSYEGIFNPVDPGVGLPDARNGKAHQFLGGDNRQEI
ncbi:MAG: hypothetical protein OEU76_02160, partial [Cyclobacteriaceae bacterium]|nr:hypothetical protein [Cyclobacteriaceae bacterium]